MTSHCPSNGINSTIIHKDKANNSQQRSSVGIRRRTLAKETFIAIWQTRRLLSTNADEDLRQNDAAEFIVNPQPITLFHKCTLGKSISVVSVCKSVVQNRNRKTPLSKKGAHEYQRFQGTG